MAFHGVHLGLLDGTEAGMEATEYFDVDGFDEDSSAADGGGKEGKHWCAISGL